MISPANGWTDVFFPQYRILLFANTGYCPSSTAVSNTSDFGGTFGSGTLPNRIAPLSFGSTYLKQNISTGQPNDYNYAIIKNSSADSWTNANATMPEATATHRVFGFWDIAGNHTNAGNSAFGNAPPAASDSGGYFVLINASYNTNVAYQETLLNLCPNTYYEFSAWFRNVCPRCSCDSTGKGTGMSGFKPGPGNDSAGVRPNLNFEMDALAYYTTGDMKYDRGVPWKKFGFTFKTRPLQTFANFAIRNNSPGGGGNDWAIDDIKVSHCGPTLSMNYNPEVLGCKEDPFGVLLVDTVRFIYNSYVYYKWQKSNVGGTIWTDLTGPGTSGVGTPVLINGLYQYITSLPPFLAGAADSGTYYRVTVATTAANLANNCAFRTQNTTMIRAITCGLILNGNFTQFKGNVINKKAILTWSTSGEQNILEYDIEKSADGINFSKAGSLIARNISQARYNFTDDEEFKGSRFYRLKMKQQDDKFKYSNIIELKAALSFEVNYIQNPFGDHIQADITAPQMGLVNFHLYNDKGQVVKLLTQNVLQGSNRLNIPGMSNLNPGIYVATIEIKNEVYRTKLIKR
jgi:hypothetical protein